MRAQLLFSNKFRNSLLPMQLMIFKLVRKFLHIESIQNDPHTGRSHTATTAEMQDKVREIVEQHAQTSTWHLATHVRISSSSVRWYLQKDVKFCLRM